MEMVLALWVGKYLFVFVGGRYDLSIVLTSCFASSLDLDTRHF